MGADLLHGVEAIANHLEVTKRLVLHLHEYGALPTFKMGRMVCARRSTLAAHFAAQEAAAPSPKPRQRTSGKPPGRPASVILGITAIAERLGMDERRVAELERAREVPTYMAEGRLCALATELDRWRIAAAQETGGR